MATLKQTIFEAVRKLKEVGFIVCALVTDMGSNNISLARKLDVSPERPFIMVDDQQIIYIR